MPWDCPSFFLRPVYLGTRCANRRLLVSGLTALVAIGPSGGRLLGPISGLGGMASPCVEGSQSQVAFSSGARPVALDEGLAWGTLPEVWRACTTMCEPVVLSVLGPQPGSPPPLVASTW
ncbi:hypothetical protein GWK47_018431 [Chionoecetes opilio]|uniref:Uncharacterized protein n=1 Tax=Chionoecetes opilio TaxID=41210 RepID=A0A8J4XR32_CHIOP|nr:hypothetical protein GWK47_018431 [Chionoecetes opilio]